MSARPEDMLVGLVALALLPLIGGRIYKGLRDRRLPVYRTYLDRADAPAKFNVLLALHGLSFLLVAAVAADLLFNLRLRDML
jgi:hypothetical protein